MKSEIPHPILFNFRKHHLGFLRELVATSTDSQKIIDCIKELGDNSIDLYLGLLSPKQVSKEIVDLLQKMKILDPGHFKSWLRQSSKRFQELQVCDGSRWTILPGKEQNRYIHIHPSRYSAHSLRIKAQSVKTALCLASIFRNVPYDQITLASINEIRQRMLSLSPIKSPSASFGIKKAYSLLTASS